MNDSNASIQPESLASKLASAWNLTDPNFAGAITKEPRLPELLWWVQWLSMQPGGLEAAATKIVDDFTPFFGPAFFHGDSVKLTTEQRQQAWDGLPSGCQNDFIPDRAWMDPGRGHDVFESKYPCSNSERKLFRALLNEIDAEDLRDAFIDNAKAQLPGLLRFMCDDATPWKTPSPWYCPDILPVLFDAMALHASRVQRELARTEIVDIVFDRLDYAWSEKRLIRIDGQARTGKTEAVRAYATAFPGRARLVSVPPGNSTRDLFVAVAEALGIAFTAKTSIHKIKESVQFVIRNARLGVILDEAQFCLPPPSSATQCPARLDWIRCNIVDKKLPCVLVCTPQTFNHAVRNLRDKRGYNFDQVLGRIDLNVTLPDNLGEDDLMRVAAMHGAGIPENLHPLIVSKVLQNEAYLKSFEAICCRARHLARRDNNRAVTKADVETAIAEVIPNSATTRAPAPAQASPPRKPANPIATRRGTRPAPGRRCRAANSGRAHPALITPATTLQPV